MPDKIHPLEELLRERIVVLDGAMGTMIQRRKLSEEDYRGKRFRDWSGKDLKGSLELLNLTQPQVIEEIHSAYLQAGADIIETNTFSGTTIGLHDFLFQDEPKGGRKDQEFFQSVVDDVDLRALVREMNLAAATMARRAADRATKQTGKRRFVGGSIGPLPVTSSISPDVNDPGFRAVNFDQLRQTYFDQAKALLEGDVDLLIVETIFDTLNAKAALFAISELFEGKKVPLMISCTVTDRSGRMLSGQTVEAFLTSITRATARYRIELCARPGRDGTVRRRACTYLALLFRRVPECRPARPTFGNRFSRNAADFRAESCEVGAERLVESCWRLLWNNAGTHPRNRGLG